MAGLLGGIMGSGGGGGGGGGAPAIGGIAGATPYGAIANAAVGAMNAMKDGGDLGSTNKIAAKTGGNKNRTKQRFGSANFGADNSQIKLYIIGGLLVASLILARYKDMI